MPEPEPGPPPLRPRRRDYLAAACLFTLIAIYGSLVPLRFTPLSVRDAALRFKDLPLLNLSIESRADWVANILLFIPITFCAMAAVVVDRPRNLPRSIATALTILGLAAALSVAIEFTQIWFPPRTTSQNDIQAEILGSAIGIALAWVFAQPITRWLRGFGGNQQPHTQLIWLLEAYAIGLVGYQLLPLDLTLRPREVWRKYRAGRIEWPPFSRLPTDIESFASALTEMLLYVPIGALCAIWLRARAGGGATLWGATLLGAAFATVIELAQVLVYSRFASATDIVVASLGVLIGASLARYLTDSSPVPARPRWPTTNRLLAGAVLAAAYAVLLVYVFCWPLEPIDDTVRLQRRLAGFFSVPFSRLYWGTEFNAVTQVLAKLLWFAPIGVLTALAIRGTPSAVTRRLCAAAMLLLVAALATGIELAQVLFPPHVADVTDVLICVSGAALGFSLTRRVAGST
jgi:glycopeptide antibiotics resistance protein